MRIPDCNTNDRKRSTRFAIAAAGAGVLAIAVFGPAHAQEAVRLDDILIYYANKTPTEAAKVGSSVSVVTREDIDSQSMGYVQDFLAQQPGVSIIQNGPAGSLGGIYVRGASSQYVKVYVDGIDMSDPSATQNFVQFEHLMTGDIERIELLRGSQSMLYGSEAVGGVINIDTRSLAALGFSQYGLAEYGSFDTKRGSYGAGYRGTSGGIQLNVQGVESAGFSAADERNGNTEDDGYRNLTLSGRGDISVSDTLSLFFAGRTTDAKSDIDDFNFAGAIADDPTGTFNSEFQQHAGRAGFHLKSLDGRLETTVALQGMKLERNIFDTDPRAFEGDRVKAEYQSVLSLSERLSLMVGADWEQTGYEASSDPQRHSASNTGVFAQLMMEPLDGLTLTGGGRHDEHETFGGFTTYRLTSAYQLGNSGTTVRASLGRGFRAPSLYELFAPDLNFFGFIFPIGNSNLQPETSKSWDAGIEQRFLSDRITVSATYFEVDTDNLIQYDGLLGYIQSNGAVERSGVELTASAHVTPWLVLMAGYTLTEAEDEKGTRLIRVPKHVATFGFDFVPSEQFTASVRARLVNDALDTEFGFLNGIPFERGVSLEDHLLLDAKIGYEFAPGWEAYVRGQNLLDERYQTVFGYGAPGLAVYAGVRMDLAAK